jgi:hypothetical protein
LDAHVDEQRREQAEARVPFLLVTFSLGKQRKVTRQGAKENAGCIKKYLLRFTRSAKFALRCNQAKHNLAWILASARMTIDCSTQYAFAK